MRIVSTLLLLAALSGAAGAQTIDRIDIIEHGIYQTRTTRTEASPGTASGQLQMVTDIRLVEQTETIPARMGVDFGFRYKVYGAPGATATLRMLTIPPAPGIHNPQTGNTTARGEYTTTVTSGDTKYKGYGFDHSWELVPGLWTFEIWEGDRKLASQSFKVVAP